MHIAKSIKTLTRRKNKLEHEIQLASSPEAARRRDWMAGEFAALEVALIALEEMKERVYAYRAGRILDAE